MYKDILESKNQSEKEVLKILEASGIDISQWGTGDSKTVSHFLNEIHNQESVLKFDEEGNIYREVNVASGNVYFKSPDGKTYRLREEKQIFNYNRERRRTLLRSVSEKMKFAEQPIPSMKRGIREELGITGDIKVKMISQMDETRPSSSYPGLISKTHIYIFEINLKDDQYCPEGYVEHQIDKSTFFVWEEVQE